METPLLVRPAHELDELDPKKASLSQVERKECFQQAQLDEAERELCIESQASHMLERATTIK